MTQKNTAAFRYSPEPTAEDVKKIYDFCIVGSGAAGSIAAFKLVQEGYTVLMIEQGPFVEEGVTYDEIVLASESAYARHSNGTWGLIGYPWTSCNVGGGTTFYGGASFRYREVDFDIEARLNSLDLPLKWPYSYKELLPYYEEVEHLIGVSGSLEEDPLLPSNQKKLPLPPIATSLAAQLLKQSALKSGLKPFPTPLAIATTSYEGRKACNYASACIGNACHRGSRGGSYNVFLKGLIDSKNFTLFSGLKACYLKRTRDNAIASLEAYHVTTGASFNFQANVFFVACNAIQSAALLLRSKDQWSPMGIGNENDMVGRGLCFKMSKYVVGALPEISLDEKIRARSGPFSTLSFMDFYLDPECPTGVGGLIYEANYAHLDVESSSVIARLECILADRPSRDNRVRLTKTKNDKGLPDIIIDYKAHPLDLIRLEYMTTKCESLLKTMGCRYTFREDSHNELGSTHLHGTCRAGKDPKTSVLDENSRVHSVDNLYVIDGAFMPYPGGVNPTLTIQAHALKVATELSKNLK